LDIFKGIRKVQPNLDYTWKRHKVILSNIANADTPGYKTRDVEFKKEVKNIRMKVTSEKHITPQPEQKFRVIEVKGRLEGNDRNNVSIEREMAKLSQNRIAYEIYMKMISGTIEKMNRVIRGGR